MLELLVTSFQGMLIAMELLCTGKIREVIEEDGLYGSNLIVKKLTWNFVI